MREAQVDISEHIKCKSAGNDIDMTYVSSSRLMHPHLPLESLLPSHVSFISFFPFRCLSSYPFLFPHLVLIFPRILLAHSNSIYERTLFRILPSRTPALQPGQMQSTKGWRLCAIVVSRLLFPGNFTSFTNYPLRAHAVRKWRCSPDIAALTEKRVTVPENGDGVGSYLAIV